TDDTGTPGSGDTDTTEPLTDSGSVDGPPAPARLATDTVALSGAGCGCDSTRGGLGWLPMLGGLLVARRARAV
ncbi:MAG: hypothetical protein ABMA64_42060, partial [Myxococcota bacterium]